MNRSRIIIASAAMAIVIIGIVIWIGVSSDSIHDLPEIVDSGRLTVVTEGGSMGFALAKDSIFGFQYEIIKAFADSLGVELQISEQNDTKKPLKDLKPVNMILLQMLYLLQPNTQKESFLPKH